MHNSHILSVLYSGNPFKITMMGERCNLRRKILTFCNMFNGGMWKWQIHVILYIMHFKICYFRSCYWLNQSCDNIYICNTSHMSKTEMYVLTDQQERRGNPIYRAPPYILMVKMFDSKIDTLYPNILLQIVETCWWEENFSSLFKLTINFPWGLYS